MNPDSNSSAVEQETANAAITLLIDLAQRGEIDPWDVDVIKVIDRFFQDLNQLNQHQESLSQSGQAFLWASMLISLKADTLEALGEESESASEPDLELEEEAVTKRLPQKLEHQIRRRGSAPPPKKRRVTLSELITQLQDLAAQIETDSVTPPSRRSRSPSKRETAQMISHLAHNENLTELATELEQFLIARLGLQEKESHWMSLEELTQWWEQEKEETNGKASRVGIFWALLLLSAQSKVELSQAEFYQDLNLRITFSDG